jgi:hypothetical protein
MKSSFFLRAYFSAIALLLMASLNAQSLKSLDENNGFKRYKLGSKFVLGYGVKHKDPDGADKIVIDYLKETIGDIPVRAVELYYLKDTLAKIIVKVSPEYYAKLIEAVKGSFGPPTQDISSNEKAKFDTTFSPHLYKDDYLWKTSRLRLEYFYSYPKISGGAYGAKELYLSYVLNDYGHRLQRVQRGAGSAKNF